MALITKSNIYSAAWDNIYNVINDRDNVANPSNKRKFVYSRQPQIKSTSFAGFPYIILNQPILTKPKNRQSMDNKRKRLIYSMRIEVHTSDQSSDGSANGQGQTWLNSISDDLEETFNDDTVGQSLRDLGHQNLELDSEDSDLDYISDQLVFTRTFVLTFEDKKDVY